MIAISGVSDIDFNTYDEVWYITNNNPHMCVGAKHYPALAPFIGTYTSYRRNQITLTELLQNYGNALWSGKYKDPIQELLDLNAAGKWIQLVCYCKTADVCHRGVLYRYLSTLTDNIILIS